MPELPEVETVIGNLKPRLIGKKVLALEYAAPHLHVLPNGLAAEEVWNGKIFKEIGRLGKYIEFIFAGNDAVVAHLRMTGKFFFSDSPDHEKHTHFVLKLDDSNYLNFNDVRKFGRFVYASNEKEMRKALPLGVDALTVEDSQIRELMERYPNRKLKAFLLDQEKIAGIGNIYADEICFRIGITPDSPLSAAGPNKLGHAIRSVLTAAIGSGGTTVRDYRNAEGGYGAFQIELKVYGRDNCAVCGSQLLKTKTAGRTTRHCPKCQAGKNE